MRICGICPQRGAGRSVRRTEGHNGRSRGGGRNKVVGTVGRRGRAGDGRAPAACLWRTPAARTILSPAGKSWTHATKHRIGSRGLPAPGRTRCKLAKQSSFLWHRGADDATDPGGPRTGQERRETRGRSLPCDARRGPSVDRELRSECACTRPGVDETRGTRQTTKSDRRDAFFCRAVDRGYFRDPQDFTRYGEARLGNGQGLASSRNAGLTEDGDALRCQAPPALAAIKNHQPGANV